MPWRTNERLCLETLPAEWSLCRCGINHAAHGGDTVCRKASSFGMFLDRGFVRSEIDAIHLVTRHVAVQPLDLRPHPLENSDRLLRDCAQFAFREIACIRYFAFYHKLWHRYLLSKVVGAVGFEPTTSTV